MWPFKKRCAHDWEPIPPDYGAVEGMYDPKDPPEFFVGDYYCRTYIDSDYICLKCSKVNRRYSQMIIEKHKKDLEKSKEEKRRKELALELLKEKESGGDE